MNQIFLEYLNIMLEDNVENIIPWPLLNSMLEL